MKRRALAFVLIGAPLLALALAWTRPSAFHRVESVVESDGERLTTVVWFEQWPVERLERVPGMSVSDDYREALRTAGIRLPKELQGGDGSLGRFRRGGGVEYLLHRSRRVTQGAAALLGAQLPHPAWMRETNRTSVEGLCPNGRARVRYRTTDGTGYAYESLSLFVPSGETRAAGAP